MELDTVTTRSPSIDPFSPFGRGGAAWQDAAPAAPRHAPAGLLDAGAATGLSGVTADVGPRGDGRLDAAFGDTTARRTSAVTFGSGGAAETEHGPIAFDVAGARVAQMLGREQTAASDHQQALAAVARLDGMEAFLMSPKDVSAEVASKVDPATAEAAQNMQISADVVASTLATLSLAVDQLTAARNALGEAIGAIERSRQRGRANALRRAAVAKQDKADGVLGVVGGVLDLAGAIYDENPFAAASAIIDGVVAIEGLAGDDDLAIAADELEASVDDAALTAAIGHSRTCVSQLAAAGRSARLAGQAARRAEATQRTQQRRAEGMYDRATGSKAVEGEFQFADAELKSKHCHGALNVLTQATSSNKAARAAALVLAETDGVAPATAATARNFADAGTSRGVQLGLMLSKVLSLKSQFDAMRQAGDRAMIDARPGAPSR